jgi:hypothetical protein
MNDFLYLSQIWENLNISEAWNETVRHKKQANAIGIISKKENIWIFPLLRPLHESPTTIELNTTAQIWLSSAVSKQLYVWIRFPFSV